MNSRLEKHFIRNILICLPLLLHLSPPLFSQEVIHTVYLIGDAGNDTFPGPVLQSLEVDLLNHPNSTVIFLGDNIYPKGFVNDRQSEKKLLSQLNSVKQFRGNVFLIPGNHDWKSGRWKGMQVLKRQEQYVDKYLSERGGPKGGFFPKDGLPGPYTVLLAENVRLICIDTHWWLHSRFFHRVGRVKGKSKKENSEIFHHRMDSILAVAKKFNETVLVVGHHTLFSGGTHSLPLEPLRSLVNYTPLQIFGILGLNRLLLQGIPQLAYRKLRKRLLESISSYGRVIYASGHEHNIQYYKKNMHPYIISGSGSKISPMKKTPPGLIYSNDKHKGYVRIDFFTNNRISVTVVFPDAAAVKVDEIVY